MSKVLLAGREQFHLLTDEPLPGIHVQFAQHTVTSEAVQLPTGEAPFARIGA